MRQREGGLTVNLQGKHKGNTDTSEDPFIHSERAEMLRCIDHLPNQIKLLQE